jgi:hypothetical protein
MQGMILPMKDMTIKNELRTKWIYCDFQYAQKETERRKIMNAE